jgi:DNA (cytosine-5)-methyltransferase 1
MINESKTDFLTATSDDISSDLLENLTVKPKDIHSLWLLLRSYDKVTSKSAATIGTELFVSADAKDIIKLAELGEALGLLEADGKKAWKKTEAGAKFADLSHWRLWQPGAKAAEAMGPELASTLFVDKDRLDERPIVIDLFAGVGGLSLGFEAAGFHVKVAVDNDKQACEAHEKNFPDCTVIEGDITKYAKNPVELLCTANGIDPRKVAGVVGGPPCQGFSYMGERASADERNLLTSRFMDVVMAIEPDFFVMENVAGLLTSGALPKFGTHVRRLGKSIGEPATRIVERLPEAKVAVAKRDRQFRKRTISQAITDFSATFLSRLDKTTPLESCAPMLVEIHSKLAVSIVAKTAKAYFGEDIKPEDQEVISRAVNASTEDIALLAIGLFVDILMEKELLSEKKAEQFLTTTVNGQTVPEIVKQTVLRIAEEYDAAPQSEMYQGIMVGPIIAHLIQRASTKYDVSAPMLLNAAWYGTPQARQRLFLVGIHKRHKKHFTFPKPEFALPGIAPKKATTKGGVSDLFAQLLPDAPNVMEAIGDLPDIDTFESLREGDKIPASNLSPAPSEYAAKMRAEVATPGNYTLPRPTWNPFVIDCSNRTIHTDSVLERLKNTSEGIQEETSHKTRLTRTKVSHTLRAGTREGKGSHTAVRPVHYEYHRVISVREGARLMGYPDWMTFHHTKWHGFRLVGNGVPFELGNAVARQIVKLLGTSLGE